MTLENWSRKGPFKLKKYELEKYSGGCETFYRIGI